MNTNITIEHVEFMIAVLANIPTDDVHGFMFQAGAAYFAAIELTGDINEYSGRILDMMDARGYSLEGE